MTCTGAGEPGFWEVLRARPLGFFFNSTLVEITVSKSTFSVYCDDGLMVRSVVDSSFIR
jgi:hypothetical protein